MKRPEYDPAAPQEAARLPVASTATVRAYLKTLFRRHRRAFGWLTLVNAVAALSGMVGPWLLGGVVEKLSLGKTDVDLPYVVLGFVCALAVQTVFVRWTRLKGAILGEEMLADLREDFLVRAVALPPGVLERAGTGDLLSRITTDVDRLSHAMRDAVPQLTIAVIWAALLIGALMVTAPELAVAVVIAAPDPDHRWTLVLPPRALGVPVGSGRLRIGCLGAGRDRGRGPDCRVVPAR